MAESLFLRLLPYHDKAAALTEAVAAVREGYTPNPAIHTVDPASFRQVPGSPFAYWVSERIRRLFTELSPFESEERHATKGLATTEDFRFVRVWWEVSLDKILDGVNGPDWQDDPAAFQAWCCQRTSEGKRWVPFAKGGEYSPYYADVYLSLDWENEGTALKVFLDTKIGQTGQWSRWINAADYYFRPGLTWPLRTNGLSFRALPAGCVFGHKGPAAFALNDGSMSVLALAALMNSQSFYLFVHMLVARVSLAQSFEVGLIQSIPIPNISSPDGVRLSRLAHDCLDYKRSLDTANETSHVFHLPTLLQVSGSTLVERLAAWRMRVAEIEQQLTKSQHEIDDITFRLYGIKGEDRRAMEEVTSGKEVTSDKWLVTSEEDNDVEDDQEAPSLATHHPSLVTNDPSLVTDLLSYAVGCTFGRWDVRFATGELPAPELPDPFAPLPAYSPGMLVPSLVTGHYPLTTDIDGLLVDDPDHPDDIIRRIREVLEVIWKERAEAIEHEACEILGFKELRDYFRKPGNGGFWMDHVRRYSKSRRKAPIYWLLQSSKKNYALWIYYHRLDKDILFKALLNYVEPKIRLEQSRLDSLRSQKQAAGETGKGAKKLDKEIEQQDDLLSELHDFEDKLRRAANLHLEPDLNDGVVLNIAPLHELVPWKEAKVYWDDLLAGKYEWSSIGKQLREKGIVR